MRGAAARVYSASGRAAAPHAPAAEAQVVRRRHHARTHAVRHLFRAALQHRGPRLVIWYLLAVASVMLTYAAGPLIQFPFAFVLPVVLAAWFDGQNEGE